MATDFPVDQQHGDISNITYPSLTFRPRSGAASGQDYGLWNNDTSEWYFLTTGHSAGFYSVNLNNGTWSDVGSGLPALFLNSSSITNGAANYMHSSSTCSPAAGEYLHLYRTNTGPNNYIGYIDPHNPQSSGSGSGGGSGAGGTLSTNPSITNLVVTKGSNDAQVLYVFDWQDITSYQLDVVRSGVLTSYVNQQVNASGGVISNLGDNDYWYIKYSSNPVLFVPTQIHSLVEWSRTSTSVVAKFYGIPSGGGEYYLRWYSATTSGNNFANRVTSTGQLITLTVPPASNTTYQVVHYAGQNLGTHGQYDVDYSTSFSVPMISKKKSRNFW